MVAHNCCSSLSTFPNFSIHFVPHDQTIYIDYFMISDISQKFSFALINNDKTERHPNSGMHLGYTAFTSKGTKMRLAPGRGDWKCGSGKCDTRKNARVENAGVENAWLDSRGGKCRSRLAVWKAEPRLYGETALSYFLKIVLRLMTE